VKRATEYRKAIGQKSAPPPTAGQLAPTTPDILGPFYLPGAPLVESGVIAKGDLTVSGFVRNQDGESLDALLDVWQADAAGVYDEKGFHFRGKVRCSSDTGYGFQTVRPGDYKISEPGQPDDFRCAHIHVIVTADGYKPLTTQLYFPDDPYNATDHWFSAGRVVKFADGVGTFDFVLEKDGGS
jgi:protocatechuate 3,4-dioxygenase beta subunit